MTKILVVEDEKGMLLNLEILLSSEGYVVSTAENGIEAIKEIEKEVPDLILSDIMMPYVDGFELFNKVREEFYLEHIPFIFLTAKTDRTSIRNAFELGVSDYLTKPFENEELLKAIKIRVKQKKIFENKLNKLFIDIYKFIPQELRSPLFPILGYSQLLLTENENLDSKEIKKLAERINYSGYRLLNRIEKFMIAYELEILKDKDKIKFQQRECIINENFLLGILTEHYLVKGNLDNIDLKIEESILLIDPKYLKIIVSELIENAYKFSTPPNKIIIISKKVHTRYNLTFSNTGFGMKKEEILNIAAFQQFNKEQNNQSGNGLGLSIVQKILKLFDGKLNIESVGDSSTKVCVTLKTK